MWSDGVDGVFVRVEPVSVWDHALPGVERFTAVV